MAIYSEPRILTYTAEADLTKKIYHAAKFGTKDDLVVVAEQDEGFGIIMSASPLKGLVEVAEVGGGAKVKLSGTVTRGDSLAVASDGTFVTAVAGDRCLCIAKASGVTGDVIPVEVDLHLIKPVAQTE